MLCFTIVLLFAISSMIQSVGSSFIFVASPANVSARNGTSVTLQCAIISNVSTDDPTWLLGATNNQGNVKRVAMTNDEIMKLVPNGQITLNYMKGYNLTFEPLLPEHDGLVTCRVGSESRDAYVTVLSLPRTPVLNASPSNWSEGVVVKFTCSSGGGNPRSAMLIDWMSSGKLIFPPDGGPILAGATSTVTLPNEKFGNFKSELSINLSRSVFNEKISCQLRHEIISTWSSTSNEMTLRFNYGPHLLVTVSSPTKSVTLNTLPNNEVKVIVNSKVSFSCTIDSYPEPSAKDLVSWSYNNVTLQGPSLELPSVSKEMSQTVYSCRANAGVQSIATSLVLDVLYPPVLRFPANTSGNSVRTVEGSNLNFSFVVDANPLPSPEDFLWTNDRNEHSRGQFLNLSKVDRFTSGNYTCIVFTKMFPFDAVDVSTSSSPPVVVRVIVNYPPGIANLTTNKENVYAGGGFILTCTVYGSDASSDMSVVWRKDDIVLNRTQDGTFRVSETETNFSPSNTVIYVSTLTLTNVTNEDRGLYRCKGKNNAGEGLLSNPVNLDVYDVPTLVSFTPTVNLLEPSEGEYLPVLQCVVSGRPRPEISWVRNNRDVNPDLYNLTTVETPVTSSQSTYTVVSTFVTKRVLRASDAGNYSCLTTLKHGDSLTMRAILVAVKQHPIFTGPEVNITADLNRTAYIRCQCYAYPIADLTWYKDGAPFVPSTQLVPGAGKPRVNDTRNNWLLIHESMITIDGVLESDAGQYTCGAENAIGVANRTTFLTVKTPPKPPVLIPPLTYTWESIEINWFPGYDGGYPQAFRVFYHVKDGNYNDSNPALLGSGLDGIINVTEGTSLNITGLLPGKTYVVEVIGFNLLGNSPKIAHEVGTPEYRLPPIGSVVYVVRNTALYFQKVPSSSDDLCVYLRTRNQSTPESLNFTCRPVTSGQYEYSVRIDSTFHRWEASYCLQRRNDVCGKASNVEVDSRPIGTESAIALGVLCSLFFIVLVAAFVIFIYLCCIQDKRAEKDGLSSMQARSSVWTPQRSKKLKMESSSTSSKDSDRQCFENETFNSSYSDLNKSVCRESQSFKNKIYRDVSNVSEAASDSGPEASRGQEKVYHEVVV